MGALGNQKLTKMAPKSVLEAVLGASWGFLGALGPILATRAENPSTLPLVTPPLESQVGTKNPLKIVPFEGVYTGGQGH